MSTQTASGSLVCFSHAYREDFVTGNVATELNVHIVYESVTGFTSIYFTCIFVFSVMCLHDYVKGSRVNRSLCQ